MTFRALSPLRPLLCCLIPAICLGAAPPRTHWNKGRGYAPFCHATPDGIRISAPRGITETDSAPFPAPLSDFSLSFRCSNLSAKSAASAPYGRREIPAWSFFIFSANDTVAVAVSTVEKPGPLSSSAVMTLSVGVNGNPAAETVIDKDIDLFAGTNAWTLTLRGRLIEISGGNHGLRPLLYLPAETSEFHGFGFTASPGADILISDVTLADNSSLSDKTDSVSAGEIDRCLRSPVDGMEGEWVMFDHNLEESLLAKGGDYRLAMIRDKAGHGYMMVYLGGARVNSAYWKPGMVKGILTATPFPGIYDVTWTDAEGNALSRDVKAQAEEGETLRIQFPYQNSTIRLRKVPGPTGDS